MRNLLIVGIAGFFLAYGGVAANAANPNVPSWSPYAIMAYSPDYSSRPQPTESRMTEHRAAYEESASPNTNVASWSAYSMTPMGQ